MGTHVYKWVFENPIRLHDPVIARLKKKVVFAKCVVHGRASCTTPSSQPLELCTTPISTPCAMHGPGLCSKTLKDPLYMCAWVYLKRGAPNFWELRVFATFLRSGWCDSKGEGVLCGGVIIFYMDMNSSAQI
jgi:hypothetical protein